MSCWQINKLLITYDAMQSETLEALNINVLFLLFMKQKPAMNSKYSGDAKACVKASVGFTGWDRLRHKPFTAN